MASFHTTSRRTAVAGVLAAGSLAVLWLACMVPSGRIGLTGAAGLFPVAAVLAAGRAAGYLCWAASALLGLFLLPDKGVALLYLIFLGLYPVVKNNIEGLRRLPLEWLCKLACFNAALSLFWFALRALFLPFVPQASVMRAAAVPQELPTLFLRSAAPADCLQIRADQTV